MMRLIRRLSFSRLLFMSTVLSLAVVLLCAAGPARAAITIPVMVDYFHIPEPGGVTPQGVTYISSGPLEGNFAVACSLQDEVYILDPTGVLINHFDTSGFSGSTSGIAWISDGSYAGHFAIVDNLADRIFIVNSSGLLQDQGNIGSGFIGITNPQGITYISSGVHAGKLAVVDASVDAVYFVGFDWSHAGAFSTGAFSPSPYGVSYDTAKDLFAVLDGSGVAYLVDASGVVQDQFNIGFVTGNPRGISYIPASGCFAVVHDGLDEVFTIHIESQFISSFRTADFGSTSPTGITYIPPSDSYAIVDDVGEEVYFVSPEGALIDNCDISAFSTAARGIAYLPNTGNLAIVDDGGRKRIFHIDKNCNLLEQFDIQNFGISSTGPSGISFDELTGDLAVIDSDKDAVLFVDRPIPGRLKSQLSTSAIGSISPSGNIFFPPQTGLMGVVDNYADEVFVMNRSGKLMARFDTAGILSSTSPSGIAYNAATETLAIVDNNSDAVNFVYFPVPFALPGFCECDLNKDGSCNILDYQLFIQDWGCRDCP